MNTFESEAKRDKDKDKDKAGKTKRSNGEHPVAKAPSVNLEHRQILAALRAFRRGDFTARMREDLTGIDGQIAETFNEIVDMVKT
ncbi:MAG: hypothetical protein ACREBE_10575, partial [bacterium]